MLFYFLILLYYCQQLLSSIGSHFHLNIYSFIILKFLANIFLFFNKYFLFEYFVFCTSIYITGINLPSVFVWISDIMQFYYYLLQTSIHCHVPWLGTITLITVTFCSFAMTWTILILIKIIVVLHFYIIIRLIKVLISGIW